MSLKNLLLDCLFPKKCYGCLASNTWLCKNCLAKIKLYEGEQPRALNNSRDLIIAGEYQNEILQKLIVAFKFDFNKELVIPLFIFLKAAIDKKILLDNLGGRSWTDITVIPLPLHRRRKKWRGFNQSELLAKEICNYYSWTLSLDLTKIKNTEVQAGLKEEERTKNITGAFKWAGSNLNSKTILLVDDVITSGATMNEAEKILLAAGAGRVIKVAVAKG